MLELFGEGHWLVKSSFDEVREKKSEPLLQRVNVAVREASERNMKLDGRRSLVQERELRDQEILHKVVRNKEPSDVVKMRSFGVVLKTEARTNTQVLETTNSPTRYTHGRSRDVLDTRRTPCSCRKCKERR